MTSRAYHLFYADGKANPGTDLTFFDFSGGARAAWNQLDFADRPARRRRSSLGYWRDRLKKAGGVDRDIVEVDGRLTLPFEDGEGQRLVLVDDGGKGAASPWERSPVPAEHQIRGLGPIVLTVRELSRTAFVLTEVMNMRRVRDYAAHGAQIHVFEMGEAGGESSPGAELHVLEDKDAPVARQGAGGVHHVAFRTPDEAQYHAWTKRLTDLRVPNSGEVDRFYFRSLYFREPNGILFEIATDGPGFATDEPMETLGEKLALPPFLEPQRAAIEAGLKPIGVNFAGWVERSETHHRCCRNRWVSLRSTQPTKQRAARPHPEEPRSGVSKDEWHRPGLRFEYGVTSRSTMRRSTKRC